MKGWKHKRVEVEGLFKVNCGAESTSQALVPSYARSMVAASSVTKSEGKDLSVKTLHHLGETFRDRFVDHLKEGQGRTRLSPTDLIGRGQLPHVFPILPQETSTDKHKICSGDGNIWSEAAKQSNFTNDS